MSKAEARGAGAWCTFAQMALFVIQLSTRTYTRVREFVGGVWHLCLVQNPKPCERKNAENARVLSSMRALVLAVESKRRRASAADERPAPGWWLRTVAFWLPVSSTSTGIKGATASGKRVLHRRPADASTTQVGRGGKVSLSLERGVYLSS